MIRSHTIEDEWETVQNCFDNYKKEPKREPHQLVGFYKTACSRVALRGRLDFKRNDMRISSPIEGAKLAELPGTQYLDRAKTYEVATFAISRLYYEAYLVDKFEPSKIPAFSIHPVTLQFRHTQNPDADSKVGHNRYNI